MVRLGFSSTGMGGNNAAKPATLLYIFRCPLGGLSDRRTDRGNHKPVAGLGWRGRSSLGARGGVYPELRLMARRFMKNEAQGNTLQATALLHEVYLRLVDVTNVE